PPLLARDRLDEGDGGTLAVGARHGDHAARGAAQRHARGHLAYALQAHVDGLRMPALDPGQPLGKVPFHSARCTASPNSGVWWAQSFSRTTSSCSTLSPSSRLSVVGAWRKVHRRENGMPSTRHRITRLTASW